MKQNILKNNKFTALWIAVHGIVFFALAVLFFCGKRFKINTNLFDILPDTNSSREVSDADSILNEKNGHVFIVFVKSNSFEKSKSSALELYNLLEKPESKNCFEKISLEVDDNIVSEIKEYYFKNRYFLLDEKVAENLDTQEGLEDFLLDSQMCIFNNLASVENIEQDPFALSEIELNNTLGNVMNNGTSMSLYDGVLSASKNNDCYVMLRGSLSQEGASITNKNSGVKKIYSAVENLKSKPENSGVDFIYSGIPFHSYESSSSAQNEITIISIVSMLLIILLCIYFFRNILPVVSSVLAIILSAIFALSSVLLVFGQIHILTFVFGTTLIGTCLDYSVHFFVRWKGDTNLNSGEEIRKSLFKGITLSLVSTEICYLLLCFAPFTLLKQVAVFSFSGILSSYLTVICLYPLFKTPTKKQKIPLTDLIEKLQTKCTKKSIKRILFATIFVVLSLVLVFSWKNVRIENDLKSFYSMKDKLLQDEIEANKILDSGSQGWYFIVRGNSEDDLLEKEKELCKKLDAFIKQEKKSKMTYNASSKYIPTRTQQEKSFASFENLFGEILNQYILLDYNLSQAQILKSNLINDYYSQKGNYVSFDTIPEFIKETLSNLWLGNIDGKWFSVVMPMHFENSDYCQQLASENENVFFMNRVSDVGKELNVLTKQMLIYISIAFVIMLIIMLLLYNWKKVFKILVIPIMTVYACISILSACNVPLGFFSVTGIILVFGLSIDYIIYAIENSKALNSVAIILSFVSSAISFGALALSSFAPVYMFGLTVFVGLTTAIVCTMLLKD